MERKPTILLVEDENEFRQMLKIRLEANSYSVLEAGDGIEGLNMARKHKPDLIILDIMLPKMDGYRVARLLKFDTHYRHIPIIMLTARVQDVDRENGMSAGADVYLTKPFDAQELEKSIADLLARTKHG
jgi:DNA-binding response OmpR family regulator